MKRKIHKEDIIQSGYDLFYEKGYGVTGISEITEKIGIPKGSFYNHFKSKEEFGIAVLDYYIGGNKEMLENILLNDNDTPLNNLKSFYQRVIDMQENELQCTRGCLMGNITTELADVNESFQQKAKTGFELTIAVFKQCLENAKAAGEINKEIDTESMSEFLMDSWQGAVLRMRADKTTKALKNAYNIFFNQLIK